MNHNHEIEEPSIEALIEEQRRLACSENPFERVIGSLLVAGLLKQKLALLSNEAVGRLMFDFVWNVIDVSSPELTICQEATERLIGSGGGRPNDDKSMEPGSLHRLFERRRAPCLRQSDADCCRSFSLL